MRTWTVDEKGRLCVDGSPFWWVDDDGSLIQFIVDACNAAEQEDEPPLTPEERAAIAAAGPAALDPGWGVALSPRGHAVMEDMANYEAMHPVHNSPSSPIDEVGDR